MANILVVDDELGIRALLQEILTDEGHSVELAENAAQARRQRERYRPDLVLLDIWMPDVDGVTLLKEWGATGQLTMPVVMMSGHGTIDTAVEATKFGAAAFLEKPITLQKLLHSVEQALTRPTMPRGPLMTIVPAPGAQPVAPAPVAAPYPPALGGGFADSQLTVESAMTGGLGLPTGTLDLGPASEQSFNLDRPLREARDQFEKSYFEFHLAKENGSMTRIAEATGLERTHLYRKLKQLGIDLSRNKRGA
ncbi:response regulator [Amphibiibacter pelophylacis]|uniref:Response regulator n=1 Tax=Amphibiibacter pelophylacis TaxID=1799477 RepID=A0ACC6P2K0_9BURK